MRCISVILIMLARVAAAQTNFPQTPDRVTSNDLEQIMHGTWERNAQRHLTDYEASNWLPTNTPGEYFLQSVMANFDTRIKDDIPFYTWRPFGLYSSNVGYTVAEYFRTNAIGDLTNKWTSIPTNGTTNATARYATTWEGWVTDIGLLERYKAINGMSNAVRSVYGHNLATSTWVLVSAKVDSVWSGTAFLYGSTTNAYVTNQPVAVWGDLVSLVQGAFGTVSSTSYNVSTNQIISWQTHLNIWWETSAVPFFMTETRTIVSTITTQTSFSISGNSLSHSSNNSTVIYLDNLFNGSMSATRSDSSMLVAQMSWADYQDYPSNFANWVVTGSDTRNHDYVIPNSVTINSNEYWVGMTNTSVILFSNQVDSILFAMGDNAIPDMTDVPAVPEGVTSYCHNLPGAAPAPSWPGTSSAWHVQNTLQVFAPVYRKVISISFTNWNGAARTEFEFCTNRWW